MGSAPIEEHIKSFYDELCANLNMDRATSEEAWNNYETNRARFTLEGNQRHWLCCALYVACRKSRVNPVSPAAQSSEVVEGNCVPLMQLLRLCNLSLIQFLEKSKKWCYMAGLSAEFQDRLSRLERNYAVSMVIFKKFRPIFMDMFQTPQMLPGDQQRGPRSRKPKTTPCTPAQLLEFTWTLFISAKSRISDISDDLVNSYHLLLVCCNMMLGNALLADRRDLLNPQFMGLPRDFHEEGYQPPTEPPCILAELCRSHDGIQLEAKGIREYWWNKLIDKLYDKGVLKGEVGTRSGLLDALNFEANLKAVNKEYEEYVLNRGDFDERAFLGSETESEMGTPTKLTDLSEKMQARRSDLLTHSGGMRQLVHQTPLTGQMYLSKLEPGPNVNPVSTAVESVSKLQAMLANRQAAPSPALIQILQSCNENPQEEIEQRVKELGEKFISCYTQQSGEMPGTHIEFARKRLQLGVTHFYQLLEITALDEQQKKGENSVPALLVNAVCHKALFACCLEVVLFSYNSQRKFPWILEALELEPYYFYKVIEVMVIATYEKLSRGTIKHLQFIEEQILESLVWTKDSPLWKEIMLPDEPMPQYEEVKLPDVDGSQSPRNAPRQMHSAVRRLLGQDKVNIRTLGSGGQQILLSPQSAKKRLFMESSNPRGGQSLLHSGGSKSVSINIQTLVPQLRIGSGMRLQLSTAIQGGDGQQYIPISYIQQGGNVIIKGQQPSTSSPAKETKTDLEVKKPRMTGSLPMFLRKFYFLASVRLKALCRMMETPESDVQSIWTILEYSITHYAKSLLMDRHLDQLIMCAIYVFCKVTRQNKEFKKIMGHYRELPQAASHVYRNVLLVRSKQEENGEGTTEEVRGDLITFYNTVYVQDMKNFSTQFNDSSVSNSDIISPLPAPKSQPMSPKVRVADSRNLYISALGKNALQDSPVKAQGHLSYFFSRSPYETLCQINNMVNSNQSNRVKRIFQEDSDSSEQGPTPSKKTSPTPIVAKKIQDLIGDRMSKSQE